MADVYEQNLGQKSNLTTHDFIRVVGSDNVSYKQLVSTVMTTMGIDALNNNMGASLSSGTDLNTLVLPTNDKKIKVYRGENLSQMTNKPSGVTGAWPFCLMLLPIGGAYTKQILHIYGTDTTPDYVYVRTQTYLAGGVVWTDWQQSPTRAEMDTALTKAPYETVSGTDLITKLKSLAPGTYFFRMDNVSGFPVTGGTVYRIVKTHGVNDTRASIIAIPMDTTASIYTTFITSASASSISWVKQPTREEIDALNSKTYITLTKSTSIDTFECYTYKYGSLFTGYIIFKPNADITDNGEIISAGVPTLISSIQLPVTCVAGTQAGQTGRCRIGSGKIISWYSAMSLKAGNTYLIQVNAICA